jgi:hypothetical protein
VEDSNPMRSETTSPLWSYGFRHVMWLVASTIGLVVYLFFVTLIDGWGSRFGNGLGGGVALFVWLLVPTLGVGRRFRMVEARGMRLTQALWVALPAATIIGGGGIYVGYGMRSHDPAVRLSDLQFWALHLGYGIFVLILFMAILWLRSHAARPVLSREQDQDTPPSL